MRGKNKEPTSCVFNLCLKLAKLQGTPRNDLQIKSAVKPARVLWEGDLRKLWVPQSTSLLEPIVKIFFSEINNYNTLKYRQFLLKNTLCSESLFRTMFEIQNTLSHRTMLWRVIDNVTLNSRHLQSKIIGSNKVILWRQIFIFKHHKIDIWNVSNYTVDFGQGAVLGSNEMKL